MSQNRDIYKGNDIAELMDRIRYEVKARSREQYIPNIIEFCESKVYLNLPAKNAALHPMQQIILKTFYRGQPGNEDLKLTEEEIKVLYVEKMDKVLQKYHSDELFRDLVLVLGRRCVSENTTILLANGECRKIGELWDNGIKKIDVISLDETDYNFYKSPKSEIILNGIKPTYEIKLSDGRGIETTGNHPFLTIEGWKNCEDLTMQDRVAVPSRITTDPISTMPSHEAKLLGYMIGDGCCSTGNLFFTCANREILEDFESCLNQLSKDIKIQKDIWTSADSKDIQYKIRKRTNAVETYYDHNAKRNKIKPKKNDLYILLENHKLTGKTAHAKFVPSVLFRCPKATISLFLKALFSCDGSIYNKWSARDQIHRTSVSYTTVSKQLALDVKHLLLRFRVTSRLRKRKVKSNFSDKCIAFEINIDSSSSIKAFTDQIGFIGKNLNLNIAELNDDSSNSKFWSIPQKIWQHIDKLKIQKGIKTDRALLGNSNERCRRNSSPNRTKVSVINHVLQDNHLARIVNPNILWMPIKSIKYIGEKRTFDISVDQENRHNFVANDIILHNSGKDYMVSLIALYEAMRLLEMPGGSPFRFYKLAEGNPIFILTVATSSDQARILFLDIKEKMMSSEYFRDKIGSVELDKIYLLTPHDKKKNKSIIESGVENVAAQTKGSVVIMSGHSNSESLLGKRIYTLLLDEVASFKSTGGSTSGDRIYSALTPATADFQRLTGKVDDNGLPIKVRDSKVISISSPRSEEGKLFQLYKTADEDPFRLAIKLPTWKVNIAFTEDDLRREFKHMSPDEWNMEFGAEFSGTAGEKFVADKYVDEAMEIGAELGLNQKTQGIPGMIYYAHLDPASTSHNYALIILHIEQRIRLKEQAGKVVKEKTKMFIVDHIMSWQPIAGQAINVFEVDKYITELARRFRFAMVSYDNWNSQASVQLLRRKGIPTKITPFRKQYKMSIYDNLHYLLVNHQLALPNKGIHAQAMEMELKCLKRIYNQGGFKIQPNPEAQKTTDDLCDSLAGACAVAMDNIYTGYPQSTVVNMPHAPSIGSNQIWKIGQGTYNDVQWRFMNRKFGH